MPWPGGDPHLGGDDWDALIMEHIIREYLGGRPKRARGSRGGVPGGRDDDAAAAEEARVGLLDFTDSRVLGNLKALAEAAKLGLSSSEEVTLRCARARAAGAVGGAGHLPALKF